MEYYSASSSTSMEEAPDYLFFLSTVCFVFSTVCLVYVIMESMLPVFYRVLLVMPHAGHAGIGCLGIYLCMTPKRNFLSSSSCVTVFFVGVASAWIVLLFRLTVSCAMISSIMARQACSTSQVLWRPKEVALLTFVGKLWLISMALVAAVFTVSPDILEIGRPVNCNRDYFLSGVIKTKAIVGTVLCFVTSITCICLMLILYDVWLRRNGGQVGVANIEPRQPELPPAEADRTRPRGDVSPRGARRTVHGEGMGGGEGGEERIEGIGHSNDRRVCDNSYERRIDTQSSQSGPGIQGGGNNNNLGKDRSAKTKEMVANTDPQYIHNSDGTGIVRVGSTGGGISLGKNHTLEGDGKRITDKEQTCINGVSLFKDTGQNVSERNTKDEHRSIILNSKQIKGQENPQIDDMRGEPIIKANLRRAGLIKENNTLSLIPKSESKRLKHLKRNDLAQKVSQNTGILNPEPDRQKIKLSIPPNDALLTQMRKSEENIDRRTNIGAFLRETNSRQLTEESNTETTSEEENSDTLTQEAASSNFPLLSSPRDPTAMAAIAPDTIDAVNAFSGHRPRYFFSKVHGMDPNPSPEDTNEQPQRHGDRGNHHQALILDYLIGLTGLTFLLVYGALTYANLSKPNVPMSGDEVRMFFKLSLIKGTLDSFFVFIVFQIMARR